MILLLILLLALNACMIDYILRTGIKSIKGRRINRADNAVRNSKSLGAGTKDNNRGKLLVTKDKAPHSSPKVSTKRVKPTDSYTLVAEEKMRRYKANSPLEDFGYIETEGIDYVEERKLS